MSSAPTLPVPPHPRTIRRVNELLVEQYGTRQPEVRDPLDGLILIILSQATNDYNCDRAFNSLKTRFPTWEEALAAPVTEIADAIRAGGLANQKAARIHQLLREIQEDRGSLDLSWMHTASAQECREYMGKFHGVGPKTIACVLVFFLDKPAFPVDTHVFRVTARFGWIRKNAPLQEAHDVLEAAIPDDCKLDLHVNLIAHGRAVCRADGNGGPRCGDCTIRRFCAYGKSLKTSELKFLPTTNTSNRDPDFFVTIKSKKSMSNETTESAHVEE